LAQEPPRRALGTTATAKLLRAAVTEERLPEATKVAEPLASVSPGTIEIHLPKGKLSITGKSSC